MRRAAWFGLAAALCFASPASAQQAHEDDGQRSCYTSESAKKCAEKHFKQRTQFGKELLERWRKLFERGTWVQETNCQKVRTALFDLFDMAESAVNGKTAEIYFALPKNNDAGWMGSYWDSLGHGTEHLVVVNDTLSREWQWKILQHEAGHHAGFGHTGSFTAYSAEGCATMPDDDDDDGGGTENDPGTDDPTCITETVWEERWVSCSNNGGSGSGSCTGTICNLPGLDVCIQLVYVPVEVTVCY